MDSLLRPVAGVVREVAAFSRLAAEHRSLLRFATDAISYRALRLAPTRTLGRPRQINLAGEVNLTYRLNRGDIQTVREVWLDEIYRLPFELQPRTVLDLGANIGLATVWFAHTYGSSVIAVEPLAENVELLRRNATANRVVGEVIQAAVGSHGGVGRFEQGPTPNQGHLSIRGHEVEIIGVAALLDQIGHVDLVKMDVEGGEAALLNDASWLECCDSLIAEFHPTLVDYPALVRVIEDTGFVFFRGGSVLSNTYDFFLKSSGSMYRAAGRPEGRYVGVHDSNH